MKIKVDANKVDIVECDIINKGEYKAHKCNFEFSKEYQGLTKKAIFVDVINYVKKEIPIIDDQCDIPYEVLNGDDIELRVYAYDILDEELILRYSPSYSGFRLYSGSYIEDTEPSEEITPSQYEQYTDALNKGLIKVDASLKTLSDTNIETLKNSEYAKEQGDNAKTIAKEVQSKLEKGELNGATFVPNVDVEGNLSFVNDKGLANPEPVNIMGPKGDKGDCNFATFKIENGYLIMNKTEDMLLDFNLNENGELEVIIDG